LFCLFSPVAQNFISQFAHLFDGTRFSLMGATSLGHGLIEHICNAQQPTAQVRAIGKALIQTLFRLILVFI